MLALRVVRPIPDSPNRFLGGSGDSRRIGTAFALSIALHAAALSVLVPRFPGRPSWPGPDDHAVESLQVGFATRDAAPAASTATVDAPAIRGAQRASAPARTVPAPSRPTRATVAEGAQPGMGHERDSPPLLVAPAPQAPAQTPYAAAPGPGWWRPNAGALAQARAAPTVGGDLSSSVAAHRRERAEQSAAAKAEGGGHDRIVASGTPAPQQPVEDERRYRGGLFAITRMAYDDAEFLFFGWQDEADRKPTQAFEVRLGANRDMRIAVVRRMIALIREREQAEFQWQSWRLGRIVVLSARPEDSVTLENFLLREFFDGARTVESR